MRNQEALKRGMAMVETAEHKLISGIEASRLRWIEPDGRAVLEAGDKPANLPQGQGSFLQPGEKKYLFYRLKDREGKKGENRWLALSEADAGLEAVTLEDVDSFFRGLIGDPLVRVEGTLSRPDDLKFIVFRQTNGKLPQREELDLEAVYAFLNAGKFEPDKSSQRAPWRG